MKAGYVVVLVLLAFAAGALLSGALAQPGAGMMGMMGGEDMQSMMDACARIMESHATEGSAASATA